MTSAASVDARTVVDERLTITVAELAHLLGVGRNAAYALVREGRVRSLKVGSRIIIPTSAVRELLGETKK